MIVMRQDDGRMTALRPKGRKGRSARAGVESMVSSFRSDRGRLRCAVRST